MTNIKISDITLRECEFESASKLSFKEKQEIAKLLDKLGTDVIESGYIVKTPADSVYIRMLAGAIERSVLSVPFSPTRESIDETWDALSKAAKPRLNLIIPTSAIGMEYSLQKKPDDVLPLVEDLIAYAKSVCDDVEFTAEDAVRSEIDFLAKVLKTAIKAGAGTITLCDASGELLPDEVSSFVTSVIDAVPEMKKLNLGFHLKDNLGLASAAALKAISAGVNLIKVSGGNNSDTLSLERFLDILKIRGEALGIACSLSTVDHHRICARLSKLTGTADTPARKISLDDELGGEKTKAALPADADIIALRGYVKDIGYDISEEDLERIYAQYKDISRGKTVVADDIEAIIAETAGQAPPTYQLGNFVINSGSSIAATAYLEFIKDGEVSVALSSGDGPIDAAFKAAESIFGTGYELEDFQIHSVTGGREATGDTLIKLRHDGKLYSGRGVSTDIVGASIRAYLSAVNKILADS